MLLYDTFSSMSVPEIDREVDGYLHVTEIPIQLFLEKLRGNNLQKPKIFDQSFGNKAL